MKNSYGKVKKTGTFSTGGIEQGSLNKDAPACAPSGKPLSLAGVDGYANTAMSKGNTGLHNDPSVFKKADDHSLKG